MLTLNSKHRWSDTDKQIWSEFVVYFMVYSTILVGFGIASDDSGTMLDSFRFLDNAEERQIEQFLKIVHMWQTNPYMMSLWMGFEHFNTDVVEGYGKKAVNTIKEEVLNPIGSGILGGLSKLSPFGSASAGSVAWDGGGADNNWNTPNNWNPDGVPITGDDVTIDASGTTIILNDHIGGGQTNLGLNSFRIDAGTLNTNDGSNRMFTVTGEVIVIGTINATGSDIFFGGLKIENGGEYIATTATTTITGEIDVSGTKYALWTAYGSTHGNGTFTHSNGTVHFKDATNTTHPIVQSGGDKFYDVEVTLTGAFPILIAHHNMQTVNGSCSGSADSKTDCEDAGDTWTRGGNFTLHEGKFTDGSNGFHIGGDVLVKDGGFLQNSTSTSQVKYSQTIEVESGGTWKAPTGFYQLNDLSGGAYVINLHDGAMFYHQNGTIELLGGHDSNSYVHFGYTAGYDNHMYNFTIEGDHAGGASDFEAYSHIGIENDFILEKGRWLYWSSYAFEVYGNTIIGGGASASELTCYGACDLDFYGPVTVKENGNVIGNHPSTEAETEMNFHGGLHIAEGISSNDFERPKVMTASSIVNDSGDVWLNLRSGYTNNPILISGGGGTLDGDFDSHSTDGALAFDIDTEAVMDFAGSGDYVEMGDGVSRTWTNGITSSAWIYRTGSDEDFVNVLDASNGFSWSIFADGRLWWYAGDLSTANAQSPTSPSTLRIPENSWQHVALSYNPDTDTMTSYLNGQIFYCWGPSGCGTTATITGTIANGTSNNNIGKWSNSNYNWEGKIADSRLYDEALDISEIQLLASRVYRETPTTPFAWWKLNDTVNAIDNLGSCDGTPSDCDGTAHWDGGNWVYPYTVNIHPGTVLEENVTVSNGTLSGLASSYINFDGTNDILHTSSDFTMSHDNSTISIWVKKDNATGNEDNIMGETDDPNQHWFKIDTNGDIEFRDYGTGSVRCDTAITDTEWHHVVVTLNGDDNGAIYVDGVAQTLTTNAVSADLTFDSFGARGSTTDPFDGKMRDIRVYDVGLSADQVNSLYLNTLLATPQHHWRLDEGSWTGSYDRLDTGYATAAPLNASGATMQNADVHIGNLWIDGADSTFSAPRGELILDGELRTAGALQYYCINEVSGGEYIHNNGKVNFQFLAWDSCIAKFDELNDVEVNLSTTSWRVNWRSDSSDTVVLDGDLELTSGAWRPNVEAQHQTISGRVSVANNATLGWNTTSYSGTWSFGCLRLDSGSYYYATTGTTKITGSDCSSTNSGYYWDNAGGNYFHHGGTVELDTVEGSQWVKNTNADHPFYNFTLTSAGGFSARCNSPFHVENILRVDSNTLDCGNVTELNARTIINNSTISLGSTTLYIHSFYQNGNMNSDGSTEVNFIGTGGVIHGDLGSATIDVELDHALDFDGTGEYVLTPFEWDNDLGSGDATISLWINPDSFEAADYNSPRLIMDGYASGTPRWMFFGCYTENTGWCSVGRTEQYVRFVEHGSNDTLESGDMVAGTWNHIILEYDASETTIKMYQNGIEVDSDTSYSNGFGTASAFLKLGGTSWDDYDGRLADVRVYNSVLSDSDVEKLSSGINRPTLANPLAWYKLNESTGLPQDSSGNAHHVVSDQGADIISSPYSIKLTNTFNTGGDLVITEGTIDSSGLSYLEFDGDNDSVDAGDIDAGTSNLSIAGWFKLSSSDMGGAAGTLIAKGDNSGDRVWTVFYSAGNGVRFALSDSGSAFNDEVTSSAAITDTDWHHFVATYESSTAIKIYIDGELEATNSSGITSALRDTDDDLRIGTNSDSKVDFSGSLSDMRIYDYTLSEEQVHELYGGTFPVTPLYWWKLGGVEYDRNGIISEHGLTSLWNPNGDPSYNGISGTSVGSQWTNAYCDIFTIHQDEENTVTCTENTGGSGWAGFGDGGYTGNTTSIWDQQGHDRIYENEVYVAEFDLIVHPGTDGSGPFKWGLQTSPVGSACASAINITQSPATSGRIVHTYIGNGNASCESSGGLFSVEMQSDGSNTQSFSISNAKLTKYTGAVATMMDFDSDSFSQGAFSVSDVIIQADGHLIAPTDLLRFNGDFHTDGTFTNNEGTLWNVKSGGKINGTVDPVLYKLGCGSNFEIEYSITVEKEINCYAIDLRDSGHQVLLTVGTEMSQGTVRASLVNAPSHSSGSWNIELNSTYKHGIVGASEQFPALIVATRQDGNSLIQNSGGGAYITLGDVIVQGTLGKLGNAEHFDITGDVTFEHLYLRSGATFDCNNHDVYFNSLTIVGTFNSGGSCTINQLGAQGHLLGDIGDMDYNVSLDSVFNFDGDDYIKGSDTSLLDFGSSDFTVSVWTNAIYTSQGSSYNTLVTNGEASSTGDGFALNIMANGQIWFKAGGGSYVTTSTGAYANDGTWAHIAGVKNGTELLIYVNGEQVYASNVTNASINNNAAIMIGGDYNSSDNPQGVRRVTGSIADVKIFDDNLSQPEVARMAAYINVSGESSGEPEKLASWWKLTNESFKDSSVDNESLSCDSMIHAACYKEILYPSGTIEQAYPFTIEYRNGSNANGDITVANGTLDLERTSVPEFDGTDDLVNVGDSNAIITGTDVTFSCWVKVDSSHTSVTYLMANQKGSGSTNMSLAINRNDTGTGAGGQVSGFVWNGSTHIFTAYDAGINDNEWHHIVYTTTGSSQALYIDGIQVATASGAFSNSASTDDMSIGAFNAASPSDYLDGIMTDVRVYKHALSEEQAYAVYTNQSPITPDHWWLHQFTSNTAIEDYGTATDSDGVYNGGWSHFSETHNSLQLNKNSIFRAALITTTIDGKNSGNWAVNFEHGFYDGNGGILSLTATGSNINFGNDGTPSHVQYNGSGTSCLAGPPWEQKLTGALFINSGTLELCQDQIYLNASGDGVTVAGGTLDLTGSTGAHKFDKLVITSGTFKAPQYLEIEGSGAGKLTWSGGSFVHNYGTVEVTGNNGTGINIAGTSGNLYNLILNNGECDICSISMLGVSTSAPAIIEGDLTAKRGTIIPNTSTHDYTIYGTTTIESIATFNNASTSGDWIHYGTVINYGEYTISSKTNTYYGGIINRGTFNSNSTVTFAGTGGVWDGDLASADVDIDLDDALDFDGGFVTLPNISISTDVTFSMWVKPDFNSAATSYAMLGQGTNDTDRIYLQIVNNQARINMQVDNADCWSNYVDIGDYSWMHVAIVRDNTSGDNQFYINGIDAGVNTNKPAYGIDIGNIGAHDGGTHPFDGTIADVRIYTSKLNATELSTLNSSIGVPTTVAPIHWYKLDDGAGNPQDSAGTNHASANTATWIDSPYSIMPQGSATTSGDVDVISGILDSTYMSYVDLDGVDDYIQLSQTDLAKTSDYTLSIWFKTDDATASTSCASNCNRLENPLFGFVSGDPAYAIDYGIDGGKLTIHHYGGSAWAQEQGATTVSDDVWHHVSFVYSNQTADVYLDGVLEMSGVSATQSSSNFEWDQIGSSYGGKYFSGSLRDARYDDYTLSAEQVASLYGGTYLPIGQNQWALGGNSLDNGEIFASTTGNPLNGFDYFAGGWLPNNSGLNCDQFKEPDNGSVYVRTSTTGQYCGAGVDYSTPAMNLYVGNVFQAKFDYNKTSGTCNVTTYVGSGPVGSSKSTPNVAASVGANNNYHRITSTYLNGTWGSETNGNCHFEIHNMELIGYTGNPGYNDGVTIVHTDFVLEGRLDVSNNSKFIAPRGNLELNSHLTVDLTADFQHNQGTVVIDGTVELFPLDYASANAPITFYNITHTSGTLYIERPIVVENTYLKTGGNAIHYSKATFGTETSAGTLTINSGEWQMYPYYNNAYLYGASELFPVVIDGSGIVNWSHANNHEVYTKWIDYQNDAELEGRCSAGGHSTKGACEGAGETWSYTVLIIDGTSYFQDIEANGGYLDFNGQQVTVDHISTNNFSRVYNGSSTTAVVYAKSAERIGGYIFCVTAVCGEAVGDITVIMVDGATESTSLTYGTYMTTLAYNLGDGKCSYGNQKYPTSPNALPDFFIMSGCVEHQTGGTPTRTTDVTIVSGSTFDLDDNGTRELEIHGDMYLDTGLLGESMFSNDDTDSREYYGYNYDDRAAFENENVTWETWVKVQPGSNAFTLFQINGAWDDQRLFMAGDGKLGLDVNLCYSSCSDSTHISSDFPNHGDYSGKDLSGDIRDGTWHHIVVIIGSDTYPQVWLDGVLIAKWDGNQLDTYGSLRSDLTGYYINGNSTYPVYVNGYATNDPLVAASGGQGTFDMSMFRVFDGTKTIEDIRADMFNRTPVNNTGATLVANWLFTKGTDYTYVNDESGNGYELELRNNSDDSSTDDAWRQKYGAKTTETSAAGNEYYTGVLLFGEGKITFDGGTTHTLYMKCHQSWKSAHFYDLNITSGDTVNAIIGEYYSCGGGIGITHNLTVDGLLNYSSASRLQWIGADNAGASALDGTEVLSSSSDPITSSNLTGGMWGTTGGNNNDKMYFPAYNNYASVSHQFGTIIMTGDWETGEFSFDGGDTLDTNGYDILTVRLFGYNPDNLIVGGGSTITFRDTTNTGFRNWGGDKADLDAQFNGFAGAHFYNENGSTRLEGSTNVYTGADDITVSGWYQFKDGGTYDSPLSYDPYVSMWGVNGTGDGGLSIIGNSFLMLANGGCFRYFSNSDMGDILNGEWHHVVAYADWADPDTYRLFVDGVEVSGNGPVTGSCGSVDATSMGGSITIGSGGYGAFEGGIADVRFFSGDKTGDVATLYNSGNNPATNEGNTFADSGNSIGADHWYKLNETDDFTADANDSVGSEDLTKSGKVNSGNVVVTAENPGSNYWTCYTEMTFTANHSTFEYFQRCGDSASNHQYDVINSTFQNNQAGYFAVNLGAAQIVRFNENTVSGNQYGFGVRAMWSGSSYPLYFNNNTISGSITDVSAFDGVAEFKNSNFDISKVAGTAGVVSINHNDVADSYYIVNSSGFTVSQSSIDNKVATIAPTHVYVYEGTWNLNQNANIDTLTLELQSGGEVHVNTDNTWGTVTPANINSYPEIGTGAVLYWWNSVFNPMAITRHEDAGLIAGNINSTVNYEIYGKADFGDAPVGYAPTSSNAIVLRAPDCALPFLQYCTVYTMDNSDIVQMLNLTIYNHSKWNQLEGSISEYHPASTGVEINPGGLWSLTGSAPQISEARRLSSLPNGIWNLTPVGCRTDSIFISLSNIRHEFEPCGQIPYFAFTGADVWPGNDTVWFDGKISVTDGVQINTPSAIILGNTLSSSHNISVIVLSNITQPENLTVDLWFMKMDNPDTVTDECNIDDAISKGYYCNVWTKVSMLNHLDGNYSYEFTAWYPGEYQYFMEANDTKNDVTDYFTFKMVKAPGPFDKLVGLFPLFITVSFVGVAVPVITRFLTGGVA